MFRPNMIEFDPPSDFVDDDGGGGGGKKTFLKVAGLGCAGILVLFTILAGAGAFKAVSCCGDAVNVGKKTEVVTISSLKVAALLRNQSYDEAHKQFSANLQKKTPLPALKSMFQPHEALIKGSTPMLVDVKPVLPEGKQEDLEALKNINQWRFKMRFYPQKPLEQKKVLHMSLLVIAGESKAEDLSDLKVSIDHIGVQARDLNVEQESAAKAVTKMHNTLQLDGAQAAYRYMSPAFRQATAKDAFEQFISGQGDLFTASTLKVLNVEYFTPTKGAGYTARVTGKLNSKSGKVALVTYELGQMFNNWGITSISPVLSSAPAPKEVPKKPAEPTKTGSDDAPKKEADSKK